MASKVWVAIQNTTSLQNQCQAFLFNPSRKLPMSFCSERLLSMYVLEIKLLILNVQLNSEIRKTQEFYRFIDSQYQLLIFSQLLNFDVLVTWDAGHTHSVKVFCQLLSTHNPLIVLSSNQIEFLCTLRIHVAVLHAAISTCPLTSSPALRLFPRSTYIADLCFRVVFN